jgi:tetratricopeptide (TPR) repeat protein
MKTQKIQMKFKNVLAIAVTFCSPCMIASAQNLQEAIRLADNEQYEHSTSIIKDLIAKEPSNAVYYYYLGENYLLTDNNDSALKMYELGAKTDPTNLLIEVGKAKYDLNMYNVQEVKRLSSLTADDYQKAKAAYDKLS